MSLQTACAAQVATPETHGTALGLLMGSFSLTYVSIFCSKYRTDHVLRTIELFSERQLVASLLGRMGILPCQCIPVHLL